MIQFNYIKKNKKKINFIKNSQKFLIFNKKITHILLYINLFLLKNISKKKIISFRNIQKYFKLKNITNITKNKIFIFPGTIVGPIDHTHHLLIHISSFKISKNVENHIINNGGEFSKLECNFIYKKNLKNLKIIKNN
ncbi:hypothetical protein M951_chr390 (nucleomorph) [Lotharella oceanica]|uniref:Uncharacterized protein n=1 Tax=Lotharella oceanica TaxID=641309 RepID=A0A060DHJ8_9EUKA|nr:hypothetical protein M951_chr390 [Lotharella oceanica]|mmetsp:Transcript_2895/g.5591  ORF Transcript_2895/g.5591 Transcript_2895/m.5591 type:complete len:137 (+) Transcript_2895:26-436(+)